MTQGNLEMNWRERKNKKKVDGWATRRLDLLYCEQVGLRTHVKAELAEMKVSQEKFALMAGIDPNAMRSFCGLNNNKTPPYIEDKIRKTINALSRRHFGHKAIAS